MAPRKGQSGSRTAEVHILIIIKKGLFDEKQLPNCTGEEFRDVPTAKYRTYRTYMHTRVGTYLVPS